VLLQGNREVDNKRRLNERAANAMDLEIKFLGMIFHYFHRIPYAAGTPPEK